MKIKTHIKAGGLGLNHNLAQLPGKAGGLKFNHNPAQVRGLKVKLQVRAGGLRVNHNEAKLQANNGIKSGNIKQQKAVG
jgi:hypothetical protein